MGSMRIGDETVEWPDEHDATVAAAVQAHSNVPGDTPAEIIANWAKHEANSYRNGIMGNIAAKVGEDALGTVLEDAEIAKEQALVDLETTVIVKKVVALPK